MSVCRTEATAGGVMVSLTEDDVYPVGWLAAWQARRLRYEWRYVIAQTRARNWRAVRNTFNGYLCEHDGHPHDCGRGWTKRAAIRRADRLCLLAEERAR